MRCCAGYTHVHGQRGTGRSNRRHATCCSLLSTCLRRPTLSCGNSIVVSSNTIHGAGTNAHTVSIHPAAAQRALLDSPRCSTWASTSPSPYSRAPVAPFVALLLASLSSSCGRSVDHVVVTGVSSPGAQALALSGSRDGLDFTELPSECTSSSQEYIGSYSILQDCLGGRAPANRRGRGFVKMPSRSAIMNRQPLYVLELQMTLILLPMSAPLSSCRGLHECAAGEADSASPLLLHDNYPCVHVDGHQQTRD